MDLELQDQVAVVIGGAQGIGQAIAEAFVHQGARVCVADRSELVQSTAESLGQGTAEVLGVQLDATDEAAVVELRETIEQRWRRIDHVVYAAGGGSGKFGFPFWNLTPGDWPQVLQVNLVGAVIAAHTFAPALVAQRRGTLLFLASVAGQIGSQTDPPYSAAKAGLINFAQCAAKDLASYNVRVNTICPGMVKTAINRSVWQAWHDLQPAAKQRTYEQWADDKIRQVAPLGRWQEPREIADLAVFLASERARNMTGQTLNVDGGQVMHS